MSLWCCDIHGLTGPMACCSQASRALLNPQAASRSFGKLAINRTDIPVELRRLIIDAFNANGDFARADERGDEAAEVYCRSAQESEAKLCDAIANILADPGQSTGQPVASKGGAC